MIVDIRDILGNIRFSTPINKGSKRKFQLMKEDYITLKFSLDHPIYFQLGDGVDNELGIFELIDLYKPVYNNTTGGYDYELRLDAYYWKWKNKKFFYTPQTSGREASWNLTATLDKHLDVLLDNLKVLGYKFRENDFIFEIGDSVEYAAKLVSYDNVNLIDALTQMAETWECEWWVDNHKICFGRCEFSSPVDFKVGDLMDNENVNVNTMQRSDSQTTYATRVYAFGSTRNIPAIYRKNLIFDVKSLSGRKLEDTERKINESYFPTSDYNSKKFFTASFDEHSSGSIDTISASYQYHLDSSFLATDYILKLSSVVVNAHMWLGTHLSDELIVNVKASISDGEVINVLEKKIDTQEMHSVETALDDVYVTFPNSGNIMKILITASVGHKQNSTYGLSMKITGDADVDYSYASFKTSLTFISGALKGVIATGIINASHQKDGGIITLDSDIGVSLGDRYTINNIIKGKVPDNYFSKDDKELTLNGVVQKRLMLPDGVPYVDAYRYSPSGERIDIGDERYNNAENMEMPKEEALEELVIFEDEYPKYVGSTTMVPKPEWKDEIVDDKPTDKKYPVYTFKDSGLKNFTNDFRLDELRLVFQTGKLSGLDFAINLVKSDETGTTFEIVRNENYGRFLPDDILFPQATHMEEEKEVAADTYILYGFDTAFLSEQILPDAELELLKKAKRYVKKSMIDPSTYNCEMKCDYVYNNGDIRIFEVGDKVNLINKAYFESGRQSRIIGFEWALDFPYDHPIYTVGETAAYSRIGAIESKLDSMTYKGQTYNGSSVGGQGPSVYVIGQNDKTLPSDRNVFSSKKSLKTFLNKMEPDTAVGHVTFENGILVRQQEIMEASAMALIEEGEAIVEELAIRSDIMTLGEINNVSQEADESSETNDVIVRLAGASQWTVNSTLLADVLQLKEKVFPFTMSLTGGGTFEKGSAQTIGLSWSYDREITSQSINGEALDVDVRTRQYEDIDSDTSYTLSAECGGQIYTKSAAVLFRLKKYYGVSDKEALTNEEILALSTLWAERGQGSTVFDCTGGKYVYYILPASMASGIQFWVGGLRNSDWVEEVRDITNAYGHTEKYIIFRLNSIQTGVLNIEVK